ncbi:hypothetical protein U1Q18_030712 [Sarracenia purpurea var. burkii]
MACRPWVDADSHRHRGCMLRDPPMQQYPPVPGQVNYHDVAQVLCGRPRPWYDGLIFQHELTNAYQLLNLIVSATINPRGHVSDINRERGYELYAIGTGKDIVGLGW